MTLASVVVVVGEVLQNTAHPTSVPKLILHSYIGRLIKLEALERGKGKVFKGRRYVRCAVCRILVFSILLFLSIW